MRLAYWMYLGPAHVGTLRIASSFTNVHAIMHAPLGDDYFSVLRSMLERKRGVTAVTASVVDRHVLARGSQEKVIQNIQRKDTEEIPDLVILTPTCTSSILQEDLQNFVNRAARETQADILLADVNHYRVNEMEAADRTLRQIVDHYLGKKVEYLKTVNPSVNVLGIVDLSFHTQHDITELKHLLADLGISINMIMPTGVSVQDLVNLPKAWFNIVPYREIGLKTAEYLKEKYDMPYISTAPIGVMETGYFIRQIKDILKKQGVKIQTENYIDNQSRFVSQSAWFSKSIDCQNLTGKTAFVFGDATHAAGITKILTNEMGIQVCMSGTFCKSDQEWFNKEIGSLSDQVIITDNHKVVADLILQLQPNAIFGTQMERHIAKNYNIPCGVISSPVHIQNFPLAYRPFYGYEGANQVADIIYNSFTLGMEDHLLEIFGGHDFTTKTFAVAEPTQGLWSPEAWEQLQKIPGFVRKNVQRKTEAFAISKKESTITLKTLIECKEGASHAIK